MVFDSKEYWFILWNSFIRLLHFLFFFFPFLLSSFCLVMAVFLGDDDQPPLNPALFPWRWALQSWSELINLGRIHFAPGNQHFLLFG